MMIDNELCNLKPVPNLIKGDCRLLSASRSPVTKHNKYLSNSEWRAEFLPPSHPSLHHGGFPKVSLLWTKPGVGKKCLKWYYGS